MKDVVEILKIRKYKAGYEIREEKVLTHFEDKPPGHTVTIKSAYTPTGDYIGNPKHAFFLCRKKKKKLSQKKQILIIMCALLVFVRKNRSGLVGHIGLFMVLV